MRPIAAKYIPGRILVSFWHTPRKRPFGRGGWREPRRSVSRAQTYYGRMLGTSLRHAADGGAKSGARSERPGRFQGVRMNSIDVRLNRLKAAVAAEYARRPSPDAGYADGMERYRRRRAKEIKRRLEKLGKPRRGLDSEPTEIYFIECGNFIKIGHSTTPGRRLAGIEVDNPHPVGLLHVARGTISDEKLLYEHFAHLRHRGEWFRRDSELLAFIEKLKAKNPTIATPTGS
jgi:hypothetical protein